MKLFSYKYLSQEQLKRLDTYKYASIDTSPISLYIMHPFWNFVVEFVPTSIAPNVLTLAGFACTVTSALLLTYYDYRFYASSDDMRQLGLPIPALVWLICAINLFLAHTLDGIDGKQARRTKATGPLGELMDHGVDSWTALFVPMYVYSFFGSSDYSFGPHRMLFVFWSVFLTFYITHWEKYNTGVLYLPWSYDISQLFLFGCSLVTYYSSYQLWKSHIPIFHWPVSQLFEVLLYGKLSKLRYFNDSSVMNQTRVHYVVVEYRRLFSKANLSNLSMLKKPLSYHGETVSIALTLPLPIYNVYTTCRSGKAKYNTLKEVIRPMVPFCLLFLVSVIWAFWSKTDVLSQDPRLYFFTVGTIFSNISCRLIICQMSSTRCELVSGFTFVFFIVALTSILFPTMSSIELQSLRLLAFILTLAHIHYAVSVVQQMCDHFKINCLSLSKRESSESSKQSLLTNSE